MLLNFSTSVTCNLYQCHKTSHDPDLHEQWVPGLHGLVFSEQKQTGTIISLNNPAIMSSLMDQLAEISLGIQTNYLSPFSLYDNCHKKA